MNTIEDEIARYFKNQDGIVAVYLFGSHAAKSARTFSDIDIGIIAEHADIDRVRNQFGRCVIDLGRILRKDIHPVMLNLAPESLLQQVFAKGQCLVMNNRRALSKFRMHSLVRIADFGYYKEKMQKGFLQRLMEA
jgi:predicted nucleotidyltransferase